MSDPVLPTAALTAAAVPGPEADAAAIGAFARLLDGAEEMGAHLDAQGLRRVHDLRVTLLARHRALSSGNASGPALDEMRTLVDEIRRCVEAVGPGVAVWRGDITRLHLDAIVNAANERMLGGGGVDGAIHRAAGPELLEACRSVPEVAPGVRCPTGEARITPGFRLPARRVIHTVGPVWRGGGHGEADLLASAYRSSLALAVEHGLAAVAFPAISTGVYGFPADRAAEVAVRTTSGWLHTHAAPIRVLLVAFDGEAERTLRSALAEPDR